jgi:alpha-amylase
MLYQGQEQHLDGPGTPLNREAIWLTGYNNDTVLYKLIATLNGIRKHAVRLDPDYVDVQTHSIYTGSSEVAFSKGVEGRQVIMLLSNQGNLGGAYTLMLPVTYNAGTAVTDVLNCKAYSVNIKGELNIDMDKGEPRVLFPSKLLDGSGLCGYSSSNISYADIRTGRGSGSSSLGARNKGSANIKQPFLTTLLMLSLMLLGMV